MLISRRRWRAGPLLLVLCALSGSPVQAGESEEQPGAGRGGPPAARPSDDHPHDEAAKFEGLARGKARIRAKLREAPGRTGVLAEEKLYSVFDEELIIRDFFQDRRGGFFVDIGCAWPIRSSNTYYLEKHLGWTGIGIDALPDYAEAWREKRPASRFFNFLVTDRVSDAEPFYKSTGLGLSSVTRRNARGQKFGDDLPVEKIQVPATTLDALLEHEGITEVDLLAMDIEGHELTALGGMDLARFQPELVVAEGKRPAVRRYLSYHGYELIEKYLDFDLVNDYFRPRRSGPVPAR